MRLASLVPCDINSGRTGRVSASRILRWTAGFEQPMVCFSIPDLELEVVWALKIKI